MAKSEGVDRDLIELIKFQALVYDILPSEEGARKRCSECDYNPTVGTVSIAFRHLPPKEGCRKPVFGVCH